MGGYGCTVFPPGTPHHAAEIGSTAALAALEADAARNGYPPLHVLAAADDILGAQPLHVAAERGNVEVIKVRTERCMACLQHVQGAHAARAVCSRSYFRNTPRGQYLVCKGVDVNAADGSAVTALHLAAVKNHIACVAALLDAGGHAASHACSNPCASKEGARLSGAQATHARHALTVPGPALCCAAAGANPTRQDQCGDQPLHWAATKGHVRVR